MSKELPVSSMQKAALRETSPAGKNQPITQLSVSFGEIIDRQLWQNAWQFVVRRHPILRCTFHQAARGSLTLFENETLENPWAQPDWSGMEPTEILGQWKELLAQDASENFSRESLPLWRITLLQLPGGNSHLLWSFHPALLDEESVFLILRDWLAIYETLAAGGEPDIQPTASYGTVVSEIALPHAAVDAFWGPYLSGLKRPNPFLALAGAPGNSSDRKTESLAISPDTADRLTQLAKEIELPPDALLAAAWGILLGRCSGETDLAVGVLRCTRSLLPDESRHLAGLFTHHLPIRIQATPEISLRAWLKEIAAAYREMNPALWVDEDSLTEAAGKSTAPLWTTDVIWRRADLNSRLHSRMPRWLGLDAQLHENFSAPVCLRARGETRLEISLHFPPDCLTSADAQELLQHLAALLTTLALNPDATSSDILRAKLPELPRATARPPSSPLISQLINPQLAEFSDQPALLLGEDALTFHDLEIFSNQLARYLRRTQSGEAPIAVCMTPTPWIGVALLGVLKGGVGLTFASPNARPEDLVERFTQLGVKACVTDSVTNAFFAETSIKTIPLDQVWDKVSQQPEGRPTTKYPEAPRLWVVPENDDEPGTHEYPLELLATDLESAETLYQLHAGDRVLGSCALGTFAAMEEFLVTLNRGATLVLTDDSTWATRTSFHEVLELAQITHLRLSAARWVDWVHMLQQLQKRLPTTLRHVLIEAGHTSHPAQVIWQNLNGDQTRVVQFYSPFSLVGTGFISEEALTPLAVPRLGRPIGAAQLPGRFARVVDAALRPLPPGFPGDLVISLDPSETAAFGDAVTGLTSQTPLLKTGQRAFCDRAGQFHLLTSPDFTYTGKLSWEAIAPLEATLTQHPDLYEAIVDFTDSSDDSALSAWVILRDPQASLPEAIADFLETQSTAPLLPGKWASLSRFPITKSGQIDRTQFPTPAPIERRKLSAPAEPMRSNAQTFSPDKKSATPKLEKTPLLAEIQIIRSTGNGTPVVLLFEDEPRKEMLEALDSVLPPDLPIAMLCLPAGGGHAEPHERLVSAATNAIKGFLPHGICHVVSGGNMAAPAIQVAARMLRPTPHPKALILVNPTLPPLYYVAGRELVHQLKNGLQKVSSWFAPKAELTNARKISPEGGQSYEGVVHIVTDTEPKPVGKILLPNAVYHSMPGFSDSELASYISTIVTKIENESPE